MNSFWRIRVIVFALLGFYAGVRDLSCVIALDVVLIALDVEERRKEQ